MATITRLQSALEDLCVSSLISNLVSIAVLTATDRYALQLSTFFVFIAALLPFLSHISIWVSISHTPPYPIRDGNGPSRRSEIWLITSASLALFATVQRYIAIALRGLIAMRSSQDFTPPNGVVEALCVLFALEICVIARIIIKLWKTNRQLHANIENCSASTSSATKQDVKLVDCV